MIVPTYTVCGSTVFQREHVPMTLTAARLAVSIHRMNASHWLTQNDERTLPARLGLAKEEMRLANELEAAIASITNPTEQKAA